MTLLVDNQLPLALARYLAANGWECTHVQDVGLEAAEDRTIWQYAKERGLTIITKDEDF
jgi:predicted nuclease of predicted toxin-antitoxin system